MSNKITLYVAIVICVVFLAVVIHRVFRPVREGAENETEPPTPEQAYLLNNLLAKIAVDDPELSNVFSISTIRGLDITSIQSILDRDISVKQKLFALALFCKSNRPALPGDNLFEYDELPDILFGISAKPSDAAANTGDIKTNLGNTGNTANPVSSVANTGKRVGNKIKRLFKR
jgi:hypothetical protein